MLECVLFAYLKVLSIKSLVYIFLEIKMHNFTNKRKKRERDLIVCLCITKLTHKKLKWPLDYKLCFLSIYFKKNKCRDRLYTTTVVNTEICIQNTDGWHHIFDYCLIVP